MFFQAKKAAKCPISVTLDPRRMGPTSLGSAPRPCGGLPRIACHVTLDLPLWGASLQYTNAISQDP